MGSKKQSKINIYIALIIRFYKMLKGESFWHLPQKLGTLYVTGKLEGYFNDLRHKAAHPGPFDSDCIPMISVCTDKIAYFPIAIMQYALGNWDLFLESKSQNTTFKEAFLKCANWACSNQDEKGGWVTWPQINVNCAVPYSAMAQGESISVLVRAYKLTQDSKYLDAAIKAVNLMNTPVESGGVCIKEEHGIILEEFPYLKPNSVLNGWVFGLWGLYDLSLAAKCELAEDLLLQTLESLKNHLKDYDGGFWSYYDSKKAIAGEFYHDLHIAQLKALEITFPIIKENAISLRLAFERYQKSKLNRKRAMIQKIKQKIMHPPDSVAR